MEQKQLCCEPIYDRLPPLSPKYPWFVAQNFEAENEAQIFYTINGPTTHYHCRIPELLGKRIRGCFHGWVILSNHPQNTLWSLWNPKTSNIISFPPLMLKDKHYDKIGYCCLPSRPNDPTSILLFTIIGKHTFVFCSVDHERKRSSWKKISYAKQATIISGLYLDCSVRCLTCFNGKLYGFIGPYVVQVDITVNDSQVHLSPLQRVPRPPYIGCWKMNHFLKGSCTELFLIIISFKDKLMENEKQIHAVHLYKLASTREKLEVAKDPIFSIELDNDNYSVFHSPATDLGLFEGGYMNFVRDNYSVFHSPAITLGFGGGYMHFVRDKGKIIFSYNIKDKTISLSSMPCLVQTSYVSSWAKLEYTGLEGDFDAKSKQEEESKNDEIVVRSVVKDEDSTTDYESHLLNVPFHVLERIVEFCVGIEYLKFRATCKHCRLVAPMIQWGRETASKRLHKYSLVSPWLMAFDTHEGIITFTDPTFGDKYFIKTPKELTGDLRIYYSMYGWLLMRKVGGPLVFYNPFTSDIREVRVDVRNIQSMCFSAPPTSPDCMVVGLLTSRRIFTQFLAREPSSSASTVDFSDVDPFSFYFPTFYGQYLYAFSNDGTPVRGNGRGCYSIKSLIAEPPKSCCTSSGQTFLVKRDDHFLLVIVGEFGESVEVFKSNDYKTNWEKIDGIGQHMIFIHGTTCICVEAKTQQMENKIYFPRLHSGNGNVAFYSLETCRYHTFNGENIQDNFGDFFGTKKHLPPFSWIEPSWS